MLAGYSKCITGMAERYMNISFNVYEDGELLELEFSIAKMEHHWDNIEEYLNSDEDGLLFYLHFHGKLLRRYI